MKVHVLFAQRREDYEGQYAPECLEVMSEWDAEDNPEYLIGKKTEADATGEFERTEIISLAVSDRDVIERLRPGSIAIAAQVQ